MQRGQAYDTRLDLRRFSEIGTGSWRDVAYAVLVCIACFGMFFYERGLNRKIGSDFVRLDAQSWLMTGSITSALLVAFVVGDSLKGTAYARFAPYADPAVLALLTMILVFVPIRTVRKALQEIQLITPPDLDARVREVMDGVIARHEFKTYTSYVAKVGRAQFIEIHIAVPPESPIDSVGEADTIRREISEAIGGEGPQRWLTIDFTADPKWL